MNGSTDGRRLHPYTAFVRGLSRAGSLGTLATVITVARDASLAQLQTNLGIIAGIALLGLFYEFLYYQRFSYALTEDTFDIDSGVLSRREREIPLGRIQNIDISQSPFQRLLGLAVLELETAGGGSTEAQLRYVTPEEARRLQTQLQAAKGETAPEERPDSDVDRDPVYELDRRELWLLSLTSLDPGVSVLVSFLGVGFQALLPAEPGESTILPIRPGSLEPVDLVLLIGGLLVLGWLLSVALVYSRYANFRLYRVGEELRYERGLLGRYSGTIPLGKVQTASLVANPLKRRLGYVTLSLETAGYAPGGEGGRASETVLPLARRGTATAFLENLKEFDGATASFSEPPARARRRYLVRYAVVVGLLVTAGAGLDRLFGVTYWYLPAVLWLAVPVAAHLKWTNRGHRTTDGTFLARTGFWRRTTRIVPYHRLQNVVDSRSIFQRRRNLASVTADTASTASVLGGDATAFDLDASRASDLRESLAAGLQTALAERRAHRRSRGPSPSWAGPAVSEGNEDEATGDEEATGDGAAGDEPTARGSSADRGVGNYGVEDPGDRGPSDADT
jgi:putative membrane protein